MIYSIKFYNISFLAIEVLEEAFGILGLLETVNGFIFVDFLDYFGKFSPFFCGGYIREVDITPQKRGENLLKRTEKSTKINPLTVS
jgi:hypothetical protein